MPIINITSKSNMGRKGSISYTVHFPMTGHHCGNSWKQGRDRSIEGCCLLAHFLNCLFFLQPWSVFPDVTSRTANWALSQQSIIKTMPPQTCPQINIVDGILPLMFILARWLQFVLSWLKLTNSSRQKTNKHLVFEEKQSQLNLS